MKIEINSMQASRVRDALDRRAELLRLTTHEMPQGWRDEMQYVEATIASAVASAVTLEAR